MNAGKSKVMVGSSGGKMIVNSGKWPCGVCGKGLQALYPVQCTLCIKLLVADGFRCKRCDETIQEADLARLLVDGKGRADLAAIDRIRNGWMKFRERFQFLTSSAPPIKMKGRVYAS